MGEVRTNTLIEDIDSTSLVGKNLQAPVQYLTNEKAGPQSKVYADVYDDGAMWNTDTGESITVVMKSLDTYTKHVAQRGEIEERVIRIKEALKDLGL